MEIKVDYACDDDEHEFVHELGSEDEQPMRQIIKFLLTIEFTFKSDLIDHFWDLNYYNNK